MSKDKDQGNYGEGIFRSYLKQTYNPLMLRKVGEGSSDPLTEQRIYGDIKMVLAMGSPQYYEVKTDAMAITTGNFGLEVLHDNGQLTGEVHVGWFDREGAQYDYLVFVLKGVGTYIFPRQEFKDYIEGIRHGLRQVPIRSTTAPWQKWRSESLLIKIDRVVREFPNHTFIESLK